MRVARLTALILTLGLVMAMGIGAIGPMSRHAISVVEVTDDAALVVQPEPLQSTAARLERDQRRDSATSQRWTKYPMMLLAFVAALLALLGPSTRRIRAAQHPSRPLTSWWFRSGGRAPPLFQLSVV